MQDPSGTKERAARAGDAEARRGRPRLDLAAVGAMVVHAVLLTGCGSGDAVALDPGAYEYRAAHATPGGEDTIRLEGVLRVDSVTREGMIGQWEVPQLHPELSSVADPSGEVFVYAHPTYFGTIAHRFHRLGGALSCSGTYAWVAESGEEESTPLSCSVAPIGGAGAATRESPDP